MDIMQFNNSPSPVSSQAISNNSQRIMKVSDLSASTSASRTERSQLGDDFKPSAFSVICGRGKDSYDHIGNHHFRELATMFAARYSRAGSKADKSEIVSEMVGMIHQAEGTFCKFEEGAWYRVEDCYAREKASALLRGMTQTQQRSPPVKAKKIKKTKVKPIRPKIPKQVKTQTQTQEQSGQKLVDLKAGNHSEKFTLIQAKYGHKSVDCTDDRHRSDDSVPTTQQYAGEKRELTKYGTAATGCGQHSDDSTVSTWGEDPLLGFEENSLDDGDDFFDMRVFEGDDSL